jgi:hypothetical protein
VSTAKEEPPLPVPMEPVTVVAVRRPPVMVAIAAPALKMSKSESELAATPIPARLPPAKPVPRPAGLVLIVPEQAPVGQAAVEQAPAARVPASPLPGR